MQNDWILDVLSDLKTFASGNGLTALAEQLDDATLVAAAELASHGKGPRQHACNEATAIGSYIGGARAGLRA
ncbi:hypothetical protein DI396_07065 [Litorivita pollutaquae]|uniref:Uncharacterized protein n=1 Tax=Litorivita pollutaquae TaxID=2200892 RepID=A0A2V4MZ46_9RHOB|nr:hypothetical protein DI396_07065 [Litorivita pollutaquae]